MSTIPIGKGKGLSKEATEDFLVNSRIIAKIATISEDGWPMVNPVWYEFDNGFFYIITKEKVGFVNNLKRDDRVALCIENWQTPYKRVIVKGRAGFVNEDWFERAKRMTLRYLGAQGLQYLNATAKLPRTVVRIRPEKISTWDGSGIDKTFYESTSWREVESSNGSQK